MDNINTLPVYPAPPATNEHIQLSKFLKGEHLQDGAQQQPVQQQAPPEQKKSSNSPFTKLKKSWLCMLLIILLYLFLSLNITTVMLTKLKFISGANSAIKLNAIKLLIFSFGTLIVFVLPCNKN